MTAINKMIKILEGHEFRSDMGSFKRYITNKQHTQLLVEEVFSADGSHGSEWIDASEWNRQDLLDWLGY
jgi:uncharacterized protein (DUF1786 family)